QVADLIKLFRTSTSLNGPHRDVPTRGLQDRDRAGAFFHSHLGGRIDGPALEPVDVAGDAQNAVRVHAPQIRPDERFRPLLRQGRRDAGRHEQRAREALEIGARNHLRSGIRRHSGTLQQRSRRARVAPDLYTKTLTEQQSRIALPRACAISTMVGLCRRKANGTMRASARNARMRPDFPNLAKVMIDETHSVARRSWVASANGPADFPIQNLPLGVFTPGSGAARGGIAIGDEIFDLAAALDLGLFDAQAAPAAEAASGATLNPLFALGRDARVA